MGKVLVEKLLRSCENVNKIYILIRNKKGKNLEERRIAFIEHLVFNKLRENEPQVLDKVHPISGDVSIDGLEMNENDQKLLIEDVNIVFHCAANVRFDLSLRDAVNFNVLGTQRVLTLAEKMKNLQVFLHVSTTFCHCNESTLEERYYPANDNPFGIIEMVKNLKDETLELITPKLLNGLPNTYAYTKGLTEDLVHSYMNKLPIAIARPSIVISSWKEPFEGWIEGFQGPAAISLAAAKGIIRSMNCFPDFKSQTVPVDIIINAIIVIAHKRSKMGLNDEYYCNLSDYTNPPATWGQILELGRDMIKEYPMSQCLWYPGGSFKKNYYVHLIYSFLFHLLPAYFIDFMMIIFGRKPL
jgi:alcohol-forming fatty acyl-CoA reductase